MKAGLFVSNDTERFFIQKELERIEKNTSFVTYTSVSECKKGLFSDKISMCITTIRNPENFNFENGSDLLDWFSFSWYEDYPYNTIFFGHGEDKVIAPPYTQVKNIESIIGNHMPVSFDKNSSINSIISMLYDGAVYAFIVPGRLAYYLETEYEDILSPLRKQNITLNKNIQNKEFNVFFKKDNKNVLNFLPYFIKTVTFVGAGVGDPGLCSFSGIEALKAAEVCLHDSLLNRNLLNYLPRNAIIINVGKRHHNHSVEQPQINKLLIEYAKKGLRVVRLKSGDPSIFGRLAEEINNLEQFHIPYRVIPGISSLSAMAANTGMVLTRRGINRGFCVMSPIKHGGGFAPVDIKERKKLPIIFFMGVRVVDKIAKNLIEEGYTSKTKASMIFSVGNEDEFVIKGDLETIGENIRPYVKEGYTPPGLFVVGGIADFSFHDFSLMKRKKILIAGSSKRVNSISVRLKDFGASVTEYKPQPVNSDIFYEMFPFINRYDKIAFSEGSILDSFVKTFIEYFKDITKLPPILVSSDEVTCHLRKFGIAPAKNNIDNDANILYIYVRESIEFSKILKVSGNVEEKICSRFDRKDIISSFATAIFLDSESFWSFTNAYGSSFLKNRFLWVPNDNEILTFIDKKSINFSIIPDYFCENCSDLQFLFYDSNMAKQRSIAI